MLTRGARLRRPLRSTSIVVALSVLSLSAQGDDRTPTRFGWEDETALTVAVTPDGKSLVYCSVLLQVGGAELGTGKNAREASLNGRRAVIVAYAPTGEFWVAACGKYVEIRDPKTGKILREITTKSHVASVSIDSTGQRLVLVTQKAIELYSMPDVKLLTSITSDDSHAVVTSDGKTVIAATPDGVVSKYDVKSGMQTGKGKITYPTFESLASIDLANNDETAFIGTHDGTVWSVDVKTAETTELLNAKVGITAVKCSPDGKLLAVGTLTPSVILLDPKTKKVVAEVKKFESMPASLAFVPDNRLAFGLWDGTFGVLALKDCSVKWAVTIKQEK
jgi:WD40 repeat protein